MKSRRKRHFGTRRLESSGCKGTLSVTCAGWPTISGAFLRQHKQFSGSAMSIAKAAFQLFYREHLGHSDWKVFSELVIRRGAPPPTGAVAELPVARADLVQQESALGCRGFTCRRHVGVG